ncbi:protein of unknown function (plasmid) [Azospirillum lipoferum 4B]|uniref:Uncharacterized protein n=1 Tax=Azospirillum lipoferum (strain 4B) TaxID=862719 RepID=G7ZF46_AZOL4|nr:protein of unknown function [Azospirillum lipoferum 4B]
MSSTDDGHGASDSSNATIGCLILPSIIPLCEKKAVIGGNGNAQVDTVTIGASVRMTESHRWTIPVRYEYTRIRAFFFTGPRNDGPVVKRIGTDRATGKR